MIRDLQISLQQTALREARGKPHSVEPMLDGVAMKGLGPGPVRSSTPLFEPSREGKTPRLGAAPTVGEVLRGLKSATWPTLHERNNVLPDGVDTIEAMCLDLIWDYSGNV